MPKKSITTPKSFSEQEADWYKALAQDGFEDIEDTSLADRPLKKWTGVIGEVTYDKFDKLISILDFYSHTQPGEDVKSNYPHPLFYLEERLLNSEEFNEICEYICTHRNRNITIIQVKIIWEMYIDGGTNKGISKVLGIHDSTIFRIIKALREWL